jgi:hypothetical protein
MGGNRLRDFWFKLLTQFHLSDFDVVFDVHDEYDNPNDALNLHISLFYFDLGVIASGDDEYFKQDWVEFTFAEVRFIETVRAKLKSKYFLNYMLKDKRSMARVYEPVLRGRIERFTKKMGDLTAKLGQKGTRNRKNKEKLKKHYEDQVNEYTVVLERNNFSFMKDTLYKVREKPNEDPGDIYENTQDVWFSSNI